MSIDSVNRDLMVQILTGRRQYGAAETDYPPAALMDLMDKSWLSSGYQPLRPRGLATQL